MKSQLNVTIICSTYLLGMMLIPWIILQLVTDVSASKSKRTEEQRILNELLGPVDKNSGREAYDRRIRPSGSFISNNNKDDDPCVVTVNILVRSISKISDLNMEYSSQLTFRQEWTDSRLNFTQYSDGTNISQIVIPEPDRIWKPDIFFKNEKEGHFHKIIMPNVFLRVKKTGEILFSIRLSMVLACDMDLKYYPLDTQECCVDMTSYGYTDADIRFQWKSSTPIQTPQELSLPTFALKDHTTATCNSKTATGNYSCIRMVLVFQREFSFYLIQIYIPCIMLVIVSWVSFWLDPNAIPARVTLGVTTLLTMATQISSINSSLPPVSYIKAIDVWTGVCLFFVFGALLEFALVNYASRKDAHRVARQKSEAMNKPLENGIKIQTKWEPRVWDPPWEREWESRLETKSNGFSFPLIKDNNSNVRTSCVMKPILRTRNEPYGGPINAPLLPGSNLNLDNQNKPQRMRFSKRELFSWRAFSYLKMWLENFQTRSKRIDVLARIIFPVMFGAFNTVYWLTYTVFLQPVNEKHTCNK
ncbi:glutamate-gated chloride channel-like isoform X2 [Brevipalpus obovatus]|uniref:glutamate-gated chloride channel-like isoform X2 n=1 Tax=Brevipalpus obovatus TaxID=246614 RepID=UPI003D9F5007